MKDGTVSRAAVMQSLTREYNRRRTGDGLKLAWIEKAVNEVPEVKTCEDAVSRQQAIDAVGYYSLHSGDKLLFADKPLKDLPSVQPQPEIIRCKDCRYYKTYDYTGYLACHLVVGGTVIRDLDDFCSRAERRTDEQIDQH